jgi:hypothetical protein
MSDKPMGMNKLDTLANIEGFDDAMDIQLTLNRIDMLCRMLTVQRLQTDPWGWERILDRINKLNDTYRVMTMFQEKRVRTNRDKPLKP